MHRCYESYSCNAVAKNGIQYRNNHSYNILLANNLFRDKMQSLLRGSLIINETTRLFFFMHI